MAWEFIHTFNGVASGSETGFWLTASFSVYEDKSISKYRVYIDELKLCEYGSGYYLNKSYIMDATINMQSIIASGNTKQEIVNQKLSFGSTAVQIQTTYSARKTIAIGYVEFTPNTYQDQYSIYFSTYANYKDALNKTKSDSFFMSITFFYPHKINITAPQSVILNQVNHFVCDYSPPLYIQAYSSYGYLEEAKGAYGAILNHEYDLYINSTTKIANLNSSLSGFDWYPSYKEASKPSDFPNDVGQYKITIKTRKQTNTYFDDYYLIEGEITGSISYNESPPQAAIDALAVSTTVTEIGSYTGIMSQYGEYIESISRLRLTADGISSFGYGTTITKYIYYGSNSVSSPYTVSPSAGYGSWRISVIDNHGVSKESTISWNTYPYSSPQLTFTAIHRCLQDGTLDDNGGYALIEWGVKVSPLGNQNSKTLTIIQPEGTSTITPQTYEATGSIIVEADTDQSYNIVYTLVDDFRSTSKTLRLSTAYVLLDIYNTGRGLAIGKVCERDETFEISSDLLTLMHTPGGQIIDVRASLIAGSVVYYTDPT